MGGEPVCFDRDFKRDQISRGKIRKLNVPPASNDTQVRFSDSSASVGTLVRESVMDPPACQMCEYLQEREVSIRAEYETMLKTMGKYWDRRTPEQIGTAQKLAEEVWSKLQVAATELRMHRRHHHETRCANLDIY